VARPESPSPPWVGDALAAARVARLATVGGSGQVRLVPVCFAVVDGAIVSAVDHKPKRSPALARLDDVRATGRATVLVDHYDDDWTQLWWVRVGGPADVVGGDDPAAGRARTALVAKYAQYREHPPAGDVLRVAIDELRWWRWDDGPEL
jgi:PPOX class probable F420-dependent enzyme